MLIEVAGRVFTTEKITFDHQEGVIKFTDTEDGDTYNIAINTVHAIHETSNVGENKENYVSLARGL